MTNYGFCGGHFGLLWAVTHNRCGLQVIAEKHVATRSWPIMAKNQGQYGKPFEQTATWQFLGTSTEPPQRGSSLTQVVDFHDNSG
jgi:hypothetical protein